MSKYVISNKRQCFCAVIGPNSLLVFVILTQGGEKLGVCIQYSICVCVCERESAGLLLAIWSLHLPFICQGRVGWGEGVTSIGH